MGFEVTERAMRPASPKRQCFYCQQAIGTEHKIDCVLVRKKARIEVTIRLEVVVPAHWDAEQIEFHRNESTWCSSNMLDELKEADEKKGCLCADTNFRFLDADSEIYLDEA